MSSNFFDGGFVRFEYIDDLVNLVDSLCADISGGSITLGTAFQCFNRPRD